MTPQEINISYGQSGNITFTVTWHPTSISEALTAVNGFLAKLGGEPKPTPKAEAKPKAAPKVKENRSKRSRHLWTAEEKQEAMRRYAAGENAEDIAKDYGSTYESVLNIAKRTNTKRPWPTKMNGGPNVMKRPNFKKQAEPEPKEEPV